MSKLIIHEKKISDKHNDSYHYGIPCNINLIAECGNYYVYAIGDRKYYDNNGFRNDVANIKNDDDIKNTVCESNNWFNIGTQEDIQNGNSEIEHTYDEAIETLKELNEGDIL